MRKIFSKFLSVTASTNIKDIGEQELCNPALLRRYAKFLDNHFVTGDDERLMCDSAKRYLSGVFDVTKFTFSVQSKLHRCRHRVVQEVEEGFKNSDHLMVIWFRWGVSIEVLSNRTGYYERHQLKYHTIVQEVQENHLTVLRIRWGVSIEVLSNRTGYTERYQLKPHTIIYRIRWGGGIKVLSIGRDLLEDIFYSRTPRKD